MSLLGVHEVHAFQDGQKAWEAIESGLQVDAVIMEWKIPNLSGPLFLQRLRMQGQVTLPVIVLSSLVTKKDKNLLREMGVATVVEKPLRRDP